MGLILDQQPLHKVKKRPPHCADCGMTLWSNYAGAGPTIHFVRIGTLDDPARTAPTSRQKYFLFPAMAKKGFGTCHRPRRVPRASLYQERPEFFRVFGDMRARRAADHAARREGEPGKS
jgi:hypothetical protein